MSATAWILKRPLGWVLVFLAFFLAGIILAGTLPIYLYPATEKPEWRLTVNASGWSAADFRDAYGSDIETRLQALEGVETVEGEYRRNRATWTVSFGWDTGNDKAKTIMDGIRETVRGLLGDQADSVTSSTNEGDNAGFLNLAIFSDEYTPEDLTQMTRNALESSFGAVKEAESVTISRTEEMQVQIVLKPLALMSYGLTMQDVIKALGGLDGGKAVALGSLSVASDQFNIRLAPNRDNVFELEEAVLAVRGSRRIILRDVGDVTIKYTMPGTLFLAEGKPAVMINAVPKPGGNVRLLSQTIKQLVNDAKDQGKLPGIRTVALVDPAEFIDKSISNVVSNAFAGVMLAIIAILLTLGRFRNTLLVVLSIPLSIVLSFNLMAVFKVSINLVSLGGLSLAVGMVVDSAVVMMENIHRLVHEKGLPHTESDLKARIVRAGDQVRVSLIASTVTSVIVFFPVTLTSPLANAILGDVAWTVIFALCASLVVALAFIPPVAKAFYAPMLKQRREKKSFMEHLAIMFMKPIHSFYNKTLNQVLHHKTLRIMVLLVPIALFLAVLLLVFPIIPQEIMARPSSDRVVLFFRPADSVDTPGKRLVRAQEVEALIRQTVGTNLLGTSTQINTRNMIFMLRLPSSALSNTVQDALKEAIQPGEGESVSVNSWDPAQLPLPRLNDFEVVFEGEDNQQLLALLAQARDILDTEGSFRFVRENPSLQPSLDIILHPRYEIIASFANTTASSLSSLVAQAIKPSGTVKFLHGNETISIELTQQGGIIDNIEDLENYPLIVQGRIMPVKHFFDLERGTGLSQLLTRDGKDVFMITANLPRNQATPSQRAKARLQAQRALEQRMNVPSGYAMHFPDTQEPVNDAVSSLVYALAASCLLMYLFLAFQFNSLLIPAIILTSIPFGLSGAMLSLWAAGSVISLNSLLGSILLAGIVVNNAIMLIDFYQQEWSSGLHIAKNQAILTASGLRLAPILITAGTTILGMLPIAIASGDGANILQPLGITVAGGLFVSTLMTLYWVPSFLSLLPSPKAGVSAS